MQKQNTNQFTSTAAETGRTQVLKVRYHPTIQTQTPGDGARAKTSAKPAAQHPPQTGTDSKTVQENQDANKVNPGSSVRPRPDRGKKKKQSAPKPVPRAATDSAHPPTPDRVTDKVPDRPEQVPVGLGAQLDRSTVEEVEVLTRGQRTNPKWFTWRKNRITASVAHSIAHCHFVNGKSKTPPTSYLAAVTGKAMPISSC